MSSKPDQIVVLESRLEGLENVATRALTTGLAAIVLIALLLLYIWSSK